MNKILIALFSVAALSVGVAQAQTAAPAAKPATAAAPAAAPAKKEEAKKCDPKTDKTCKEEKKS